MAKKSKGGCHPSNKAVSCCNVESVISIDERGQMILPKELREKANIKPGDKLIVITWGKDDKVGCISLIRADDFTDMVKDMLGPMMADMVTK
ncbi:MAG TPA: AbrB/MazE/SpoVT family DNA-binding domain-containing protein [Nitrospirae bacterium]|nr:spoVT / AbrB like domain protein [bacterium BMS3Abin10]GBE38522.1 spoVT / AbrB like domain protein [bacterium BMS3Bbin08]HDO25629.1 AbrB/MazE/SpoVT family DNA-binding domain-containing protein [Nitrospirota bacterium]HDZ83791.1 AbrB/MazE/SpoVT family DNA-binding domain-containing protein [Nitrospirota bacterium]